MKFNKIFVCLLICKFYAIISGQNQVNDDGRLEPSMASQNNDNQLAAVANNVPKVPPSKNDGSRAAADNQGGGRGQLSKQAHGPPAPPADEHPQQRMNQQNVQPPAGIAGAGAEYSACSQEIDRYCRNIPRGSDIALLQCLQDAGDTDDILSPSCQQELWHLKVNLTSDDRFQTAARQFCSAELTLYRECQSPSGANAETSHLLLCLIEIRDNMTNGQCKTFLTRMASIVFTDFRLVGRFVTKCRAEISKFNCGQYDDPKDTKNQQQKVKHSQGSTLECLLKQFVDNKHAADELTADCRHEILRLAELQADDYHLDRPLFFACREDRERFCRDIQAGNGRVFQCLVKSLESQQQSVSYECRETLMLRLKLMQRDYKMSHALVQNCHNVITQSQCAPKGIEEQAEHFFLTYILLCLENYARRNGQIPTNCQTQMFEHRRLIMTEAQMDPEIIIACSNDITTYCKMLEGGGRTLHCLMNVARNSAVNKEMHLEPQCLQSVAKMVKAANIGANYEVDAVLYNDCKALIETVCKRESASETDVLSCLMNNIESPQMAEECEERLLEVQYFLARDFVLDPQLYSACKNEAAEKCGHSEKWTDQQQRDKNPQQGPERGYLVLTCLYRHAYSGDDQPQETKLSENCAQEVRRVMRERAVSVQLMPHIEQQCLNDLAQHCSQKTKPGEELTCLQDNLDKLSPRCQAEIKNFTLLQSKDSRLDRVLNRACRPVIEKYCREYIDENVDNGDVTDCLFRNKNVPEMTNKCRAYVNHYELMSLKDYELNFKFRQACRNDIKENCLNSNAADKASIVRCLSELLIKRILLGEGKDISKDCRKQMKAEYFKMDSMSWKDVEPQLSDICNADIKTYGCDREDTLEKAVECLKENKAVLTPTCRKYIFRRERLEFADNSFDATLTRVCADEIQKFCSHEGKSRTLHCLKEHKNEQSMGVDCLQVVERRQREQASDIRLQPVLYKVCKSEINNLCKDQVNLKMKTSDEDAEARAEVITCLRSAWVTRTKQFAVLCQTELKKIIYESEIDPRLDPPFYKSCKEEIERLCDNELLGNKGHATIVECMKASYKSHTVTNRSCKKELERKISEVMSDIHLDDTLYKACVLDLKRYCYDVPAGNAQQLKCLLMASESANVHLSKECKNELSDRQALWSSVKADGGGLIIPSDLGAFADLVIVSPARNYLLTVLLVVVLVIFVFGLCCGRVTKRVRQELKNR